MCVGSFRQSGNHPFRHTCSLLLHHWFCNLLSTHYLNDIMSLFRAVVRAPLRAGLLRSVAARPAAARMYSTHEELSDADFDAKWKAYFADETLDEHAIRRGLNDLFAHDLVPEPVILEQALRACRRVNDFSTCVRVFEGVKDKSPDDETYNYVVGQLKPVIEELQLTLPEELGFH
ncbi:oxidase heme a,cytochrome [Salpingoeca rosetta]|uniref:Oxidase heme a,cytochrome n=1 Tax=Salpingoeca rosetta (strain ATCC 50818 / BSB-021) TaxID=946362 RepID=F2UME9_SALR5|nr:oxidase heme a,cytochrome [Salpingoeca rosetta]EGD78298.1 oxidase heme a,cytochrome [Salpingoeca rosetta]|eukprot:XP_004989621.1 oxidase heme a,cytochrome [Salpingoeca rosetta]